MLSFFQRKKQGRASRVNITPPQPMAVQAPLAICAIFKNEAAHIEDWIRFHSVAGVRDFILYDNGSTDDSATIAASVGGVNVHIIPWQFNGIVKTPPVLLPQQIMAYCHAIATFGSGYRRMAFIDIDEILVPKTSGSLIEELENLGSHSNISLPWVMFGPNGHEAPPTAPAMFAYQARGPIEKGPLLNFKCIVDPCRVTQVSVHKFVTSDMGAQSANDQGMTAHYKQRDTARFLSTQHIQLNHYYTRSQSEMMQKIRGGAVSGVSQEKRQQAILKKRDLIAAGAETDTAAPAFLARHGIHNGADLKTAQFGWENQQ